MRFEKGWSFVLLSDSVVVGVFTVCMIHTLSVVKPGRCTHIEKARRALRCRQP
jgi:hypothetical protein